MVVILALLTRVCWRIRFWSDGFNAISLSSSTLILLFISAAAALVNVTTTSLSMDTGLSESVIFWIILSTNTAVFPEPAAADTRILHPSACIALL